MFIAINICGLISRGNCAWYHITPWVQELTVSLNALYIRGMKVDDSELELLARTRGKDLRVLKIEDYRQRVDIFRNCLLELALHNKDIESLEFTIGFGCYDWEDRYDGNDLTLLAKNCSKSLVSLKISPCRLSKLGKAFRHAVRLEDSDGAYFDKDDEALEFPPNMRCLGIYNMPVTSYPLVLPLVNQLRELNLQSYLFKRECQCFLIERCPNLEVLHTEDICGDGGLQAFSLFCKKLCKLTHLGRVTHIGLIALAKGCYNLEYLHVSLTDITNEALECIGTHLKNLGDLHMNLVEKGNKTDLPLDNGIRAMLNGCSKLERLDIRLCRGGLTDLGLGYIGKYGHNLKYLFLQNIGESDAGLVELSKGCPKLRTLEIRWCPFNKQSIATYVFNIRSLRYLRVLKEWDVLVSTRRDFEVSPHGLNLLNPDF
ncbi:hypothetical protein Tco_0689570 [Tanacetum coccineum]